MQGVRQDDVPSKDVRAILIPDAQRVGEAACGYECNGLAFAFEQGVRRNGCADLDCTDVGAGRSLQNLLRAPNARITALGTGAGRQYLANMQLALRGDANDVCKRSAPVDPELPARGH